MDFLEFQCLLDQKNEERYNYSLGQGILGKQLRQLYYTEDKIIDLQIISEWCKSISH